MPDLVPEVLFSLIASEVPIDLRPHLLVVVGGLVPSLLIPQNPPPPDVERHVGTIDLDLGLHLGLLDAKRYQAFAERLRSAGFAPDLNENGNPSHQRWSIGCHDGAAVTTDFLSRGHPKDAYDLFYLLRNYGRSLDEVAARLVPLLDDPKTGQALDILEADFTSPDQIGPRRVAQFVMRDADEELEADASGLAAQLLRRCGR